MPTLYILAVGQGSSSVLVDTKGVTIIDAGPGSALLEFLRDKHIPVIDVLILTHSDKDHVGGVMALLTSKKVEVKNVYLNTDSIKGTKTWDDLAVSLLDYQERSKINLEPSVSPHLNGKLNRGEVTVEILAPNQYIALKGPGSKDRKGRTLTSNSVSAVVRLVHKQPVAILPGDLDEVGLENLLDHCKDANAWLMVFPHHGGAPGSGDVVTFTNKFCSCVQPEVVVFSVGGNTGSFPNPKVIETVDATLDGVRMLTTGSSKTFAAYVGGKSNCAHRDCVGNISVLMDKEPLEVQFGSA